MNVEAIRDLRRLGKHEEALRLAVELAAAHPLDAELQYEAACVHDFLGHERDAVPYYLAALGGTLTAEARRGAYAGLGSTYRTLGEYGRSEATLLEGLTEFPEANELKVFLAMVRYNLGRSKEAIESLLELIAETSSDPAVRGYARAISFYAQDIEKTWRE